MEAIADLHVHSKYSRATSANMDLDGMAEWAKLKGITLLGTGDFTHPAWISELSSKAMETGNGFLEYRGMNFVLTVEVSNIFSQGGKTRRVHNVILCPGIEVAHQINELLGKHGKLASDGRPILSCSCAELVELVMSVHRDNIIFPAHAWTPWFSVFGSMSGFDSIDEAFLDQKGHIHAFETGLSSDPAMNWRLSALDKYSILSFSDAHSPAKLGREATVFSLDALTYRELASAINEKEARKVKMTYEFYPEEGKYHVDGHRMCNVWMMPAQARKIGDICPNCKKKMTIGVLHRVEDLADRPEGFIPPHAVPYKTLVPLAEIIAQVMGTNTYSKGVNEQYQKIVRHFGSEFSALMATQEQLSSATDQKIADGIIASQTGNLKIRPGYDGEFGKVELPGHEKKEKPQRQPAAEKSQSRLSDFK
jgi:uncharacterized protein (TIGR00375 family)